MYGVTMLQCDAMMWHDSITHVLIFPIFWTPRVCMAIHCHVL